MSRLSDTTFPNPFFLAFKMRCITSMGIKIFTIDVAGQCAQGTRKCPQIKNPAKVFIAAIILTHIYQQQPQRAEVYKVEISWT